jgi:hypothetical protein
MPTPSLYEDSNHWRERAKQMRIVANGVRDAQAKAIMLRIAADYENLAARADRAAPDFEIRTVRRTN